MKTYDFMKLRVVMIALGLPLVMNLVACEKGKQENIQPFGYTPGVIGAYGAGCANCFQNPQILLRSVQASTGFDQGFFRLDIMAPGSPMVNFADPKAPVFYSGPAAVQGLLSIRAQDFTFCYAPVGDYQISTQQVGMMSAGVLSGVRLNAVGPNGVSMVMTVMTSSLYNPNGVNSYDVNGNRIGMTLRLDWVNGRSCGVLQTY